METDLLQPPISRAMVRGAADPAICTLDAIAAAVAACDFDRATVLAFARAKLGLDVPLDTVASILVGIWHPSIAVDLIAIAPRARREALLAPVVARRFHRDADVAATKVITLYAVWRAGAPLADVVREARRFAVYRLDPLPTALLATMAREIDDPDLRTTYAEQLERGDVRRAAMETDRALAAPIDKVLDAYPEEVAAATPLGFTVRAAPRVGRNEPCPCGSGQKYKRCCADKDERVTPSPVAGLSWDAYLTTGADRMSVEDINTFEPRDLVRVALNKLQKDALAAAYRRFLDIRRFDLAERALDVFVQRDPDDADGWREELVVEALHLGDTALAEQHIARITDAVIFARARLELAVRRRESDALERIVAAADAALRDDAGAGDIDLAHTLMATVPALGVLVARGALQADRPDDSTLLLDAIEEARIELGLRTGDRAWDLYSALREEEEEEDDDDAELRTSLKLSSARIADLEATLAAQRAELEKARDAAPAPARANAPEPARLRELANKIERLEGLVREGVAERTELRQQLAAKSTRTTEAEPQRTEHDDDEGIALEDGPREVLIPSFDRRVVDAIETVPKTVAAEAMRTIGTIAAGDMVAWRRLKQAKDMKRQVLMARIGIHHRLLLRAEQQTLYVLDLVPREALDTTLKRLRSS